MALLENAAGRGHAYAMFDLGSIHYQRKEYEQAVEWYTKAAEAGLPKAMFNLAYSLEEGEGVAAPDLPAAVDWFLRAAHAGNAASADNLCIMYSLGRSWA
jgi:TPR repeat protein